MVGNRRYFRNTGFWHFWAVKVLSVIDYPTKNTLLGKNFTAVSLDIFLITLVFKYFPATLYFSNSDNLPLKTYGSGRVAGTGFGGFGGFGCWRLRSFGWFWIFYWFWRFLGSHFFDISMLPIF